MRITVILLSEEVPSSRPGRRAVTMNIQLGNFMGKSPISMGDLRLLFASIDVKPPSEGMLQKEADKTTGMWTALNENCMAENRSYAKICSQDDEVIVATDTLYNNPPKGRAMYQPATQSHTPMIEAQTGLVLSVSSFSKLCAKNCIGGCGSECTLSWPQHKSMDSSEASAAEENLNTLKNSGLQVSKVLCDGTTRDITGETPPPTNLYNDFL